ncbi:MAG: S49 family peptidase [Pseudomonadota bacterium]
MSERPPLLNDLFRMVVKMIVGGLVIIGLVSCGTAMVAGAGASAGGGKPVKEAEAQNLYGDEDSDNKILRVNVIGPILTHAPEDEGNNFFASIQSVTYGYEVKEQLLEAAKDDNIKAVMMFVTTPGGSIVGSEAIHDGVKAVQAAGKPVVAYVDTISASGGVWSTAGADKIFADYGSVIGSVGVNFGNWMYYDQPVELDGGLFFGGVSTREPIQTKFIGAGLGKDVGNPFRPMTEREEGLLTASAQAYYDAFVDHVVENRPVDRNRLINEYGAMIFADTLAKDRGYIDDIKTFQETLSYIAGEIGAEGDDWQLVSPPEVELTPFEELFGATLKAFTGDKATQTHNAAICGELKARPMVMSVKALTDLCGV